MLYIRADANEIIATGHIMRCLSIAQSYHSLTGEKVIFITADEKGREIVEKYGYQVIVLNTIWNDLDQETDILIELIKKESINKLLIDSYYVTPNYMERLHKHTTICYIDDLNSFHYSCSYLFNYSIYNKKFNYESEYCNSDTTLLLGCKYAPLRSDFRDIKKKQIKSRPDNILLLTGGTDHYHFALHFLDYLLNKNLKNNNQLENITFDIVCGCYNDKYDEICSLAELNRNIRVHKSLSDLDIYMKKADIVISAGGTTLYELCACGTPTIAYVLADNQIDNVNGFRDKGLMLSIGDIRKNFQYSDLFSTIEKLLTDYDLRKNLSQKMQNVVDGKGAERIAKILFEIR